MAKLSRKRIVLSSTQLLLLSSRPKVIDDPLEEQWQLCLYCLPDYGDQRAGHFRHLHALILRDRGQRPCSCPGARVLCPRKETPEFCSEVPPRAAEYQRC